MKNLQYLGYIKHILKFSTYFHKINKVDKWWKNYPHCGKPRKLGKNRKCKNEIHDYQQLYISINKEFYEFSTVFHSCGKHFIMICELHVEKKHFSYVFHRENTVFFNR